MLSNYSTNINLDAIEGLESSKNEFLSPLPRYFMNSTLISTTKERYDYDVVYPDFTQVKKST